MPQLSRRRFIRNASVGAVGAVAATSAIPALLGGSTSSSASPVPDTPTGVPGPGPLVAHVRNAKTGEIAIYVGTREITYRDQHIARALVRAAH